jgi:hypothetical protein
MSETVSGTINAILTRGLRGDLQCHLVFTNQRLIVSVKGLLGQIASGSGAFGATGALAGGALASKEEAKKQDQIQQLSPDQLLQSNKKNFDVPFSKISRLEIGKKLGTSRLYVITPDETYKFKFQGVQMEKIESGIRAVIPAGLTLQTVDKLSD